MTDNTTSWHVHRASGTFLYCWQECKLVQLWKPVWQYLLQLDRCICYGLAFVLWAMELCLPKDRYKNDHGITVCSSPNWKQATRVLGQFYILIQMGISQCSLCANLLSLYTCDLCVFLYIQKVPKNAYTIKKGKLY